MPVAPIPPTRLRPSPFLLALALLLPAPLLADEVSDALAAAQGAYAAGDLAGTSTQLTTAVRALARQQQARLAAFLPEAPEGWSRELLEAGTEGLPFGALVGVTAEARYGAPGGDGFTLTLAADSPMMLTMAAMLGNPQMMAMMGRVLRVNGQDMLAQDSSLAGLVGMRVLVQASGMDPQEMQPVVEMIDFAGLAEFDR